MNIEYNSRVSSKNSERLLKNLKNTTGDYFFMPHPVYNIILAAVYTLNLPLPKKNEKAMFL